MPPTMDREDAADQELSQQYLDDLPDEGEDEEEQVAAAPDTEALRAQIRSELQAQIRAELQAETDEKWRVEHSKYGSKYRNAQESARLMGMTLTEEGHLLPPAEQAPKAEEEMPDAYSEPQKFLEWQERRTTAKVQEATQPLMAELQVLKEMIAGTLLAPSSGPVDQSRQFLEAIDLGDLADNPEYRKNLADTLRQMGPQAWQNPQAVYAAAGVALAETQRGFQSRGEKLPVKRQTNGNSAAIAAAQRSGIAQITASRGQAGGRTEYTSEEQERAASWPAEWAERTGPMTPARYRALSDPTGNAHREYQRRVQSRGKKG